MSWVLLGWNKRQQNELMIFKTGEVVQKLVDKSIINDNQDICSLKVSLHKILINYEEKNSNFIVKKIGRHRCNQMIKVNITTNDTSIS